MPRAAKILGGLALVAALVIGLAQAISKSPKVQNGPPFDLATAQGQLDGAPAPLAALHRQANELLPGDLGAFKKRLAALKGFPVVINKWGSWCGPCRSEFPVFQRVSTELGKRVAFLGIDGRDATDEATDFLKDFPVTYPSYPDQQETIARYLEASNNYPITIFVRRDGKVEIRKQGVYTEDKVLRADIKRYLGV
ncbi:MAG: cytochrome c biosis protein CcmG, thiol:disulfide interchange protein DsbE [Solirubrobacteraceae bacterium]|nr:cytochrome c biosis protein CcmG, thiol:disulfide interchange protein DsbE [Solirubrobacteraceae bacterium]